LLCCGGVVKWCGCVVVRLSGNNFGVGVGGAIVDALRHLTSLKSLEYVCAVCAVCCVCSEWVCFGAGWRVCGATSFSLQECVVTVVSWMQCVSGGCA
jgi:hypothetical protein